MSKRRTFDDCSEPEQELVRLQYHLSNNVRCNLLRADGERQSFSMYDVLTSTFYQRWRTKPMPIDDIERLLVDGFVTDTLRHADDEWRLESVTIDGRTVTGIAAQRLMLIAFVSFEHASGCAYRERLGRQIGDMMPREKREAIRREYYARRQVGELRKTIEADMIARGLASATWLKNNLPRADAGE